jgi:molecular chaperone GrpE
MASKKRSANATVETKTLSSQPELEQETLQEEVAHTEQAEIEAGQTAESAENDIAEAEQAESIDYQAEIDELTKKLAETEAIRDQAISIAQRLQADFDNYKKRNAKARIDALQEGTINVIASILPVIDNFDRAFCFVDENSDDPFVQGIRMVYTQLMEILAKHGLTEIDASGRFDPCFHEAVAQDDSSELEAGMITEVLQKGYMVCDRVIRHSMVKVTV